MGVFLGAALIADRLRAELSSNVSATQQMASYPYAEGAHARKLADINQQMQQDRAAVAKLEDDTR